MRARGFSLLEALVAVALLALVMVGALSMLDTSAKVSKLQSAVADSQDSLRHTMSFVSRYVRMAGSGGLPAWDNGSATACALDVDDNVTASYPPLIGPEAGTTLQPIVGTDVLTIRGAFWGEVYDIDPGSYSYSPGASLARFSVPPTSTWTGRPQPLDELANLVGQGQVLAVIAATSRRAAPMTAGRARWGQLFGAACLTAATGGSGAPLDVQFTTSASGQCPQSFLDLSPGGSYPSALENVSRLALVQELTMFVAADPASGVPTLFIQEQPFARTSPVATDFVDLQVALGCDRDGNGVMPEAAEPAARTAGADYWLFNNTDGIAEALDFRFGGDAVPMVSAVTRARVTLVARTPAPELLWRQPPIENENGRDLRADPEYAGAAAATYRYRYITEEIKLRSLGAVQ